MDGRPNRRNKVPFSNFRTEPESLGLLFEYQCIISVSVFKEPAYLIFFCPLNWKNVFFLYLTS